MSPMEPGEEFGEVRYNVEPGDELERGDEPKEIDPNDSAVWWDDY